MDRANSIRSLLGQGSNLHVGSGWAADCLLLDWQLPEPDIQLRASLAETGLSGMEEARPPAEFDGQFKGWLSHRGVLQDYKIIGAMSLWPM